jgi:hypothetical protein
MTNELKEDNLQDANPSSTKKRKVSHEETGHAKNVANFEDVISFCASYGAIYNPSNPLLVLTALNTLHTSALAALKGIDDILPVWINAVTDRDIIFNPFSKLITKVFNSFASSGASKQAIEDVLTIVRKIQGRRAKPIPDAADLLSISGKSAEEIHKYISASQTSMDNRIENFYKLIQLLISHTVYAPNETELQTATLTTLCNSMKSKNTAVINAYSALSNARISRDKVLYHPETGLVYIALEVRKYVKSVFGASSAQYKILSKIHFKGGADLANKVK